MSERVELEVSGMTCGHCVSAVRGALSGLSGASDVAVDLATGVATVTLDGTASDAVSAVEAIGFEATAR